MTCTHDILLLHIIEISMEDAVLFRLIQNVAQVVIMYKYTENFSSVPCVIFKLSMVCNQVLYFKCCCNYVI